MNKLLPALLLAIGISASAAVTTTEVTVNNITYELNSDGTATFVKDNNFRQFSALSSDTTYVFPNTVRYNARDYTITALTPGCLYRWACLPYELKERCGLRRVVLPSGLVEVPTGLFINTTYDPHIGWEQAEIYSQLNTIVVPAGVQRIAARVTAGCANMHTINLPEGLKEIEGRPFDYYGSQIHIAGIPKSLERLGGGALSHCELPQTLTIPASLQLGYDVFSESTNLQEISFPGRTSIPAAVVYSAADLTTVHLDPATTTLEASAFADCAKLTTMTGTDNLQHIGASALKGTKVFTTLLPSITTIDARGFSQTPLTSVSSTTLTKIGDFAFADCKDLKSVTLGGSSASIGEYAFSGCTSLTSVQLPASCPTISNGMFAGCTALPAIQLPASCQTIGEKAFKDCIKLPTIQLPASCLSIGNEAFANCTGLTSIQLPASCQAIGDSAFAYCAKLNAIQLPASLRTIGNKAFYRTPIKSIGIPAEVTEIGTEQQAGDYANVFGECPDLTEVMIADGKTPLTLASGCFENSPIKNIYIGRSTTFSGSTTEHPIFSKDMEHITLGPELTALSGNFTLTPNNSVAVTSLAPVPPVVETPLTGSTLETAPGAVAAYSADENWLGFQTIFSINADGERCYMVSFTADGEPFALINGQTSFQGELPASEPLHITLAPGATTGLLMHNGINLTDELLAKGKLDIPVSEGIAQNSFTSCGSDRTATIDIWGRPLTKLLPKERAENLVSLTLTGEISDDDMAYINTMSKLRALTLTDAELVATAPTLSGCPQLEYLTLPTTFLEMVPEGFCKGLKHLRSVVIPYNVTGIGDNAFDGCTMLSDVDIRSNLTTIGSRAFADCISIRELRFDGNDGDQISIISDAFQGARINHIYDNVKISCTEKGVLATVENVTFGPDVAEVGYEDLFEGSTILQSITFDDSSKPLLVFGVPDTPIFSEFYFRRPLADGSKMFTNGPNYSCKRVTFGGNVTELPTRFLWQGYGIEDVIFESPVTTFNELAFRNCKSLKSITMPASTSYIGNALFSDCSSLETVEFEPGYSCTTIQSNMFLGCTSLKHIDLPECTKAIGLTAFYGCKLEEITIPENTEVIYAGAFRGCPVTTVYAKCSEAPRTVGDYEDLLSGWCILFDNRYAEHATLYVPRGSKASYQASAAFKMFNIVEVDDFDHIASNESTMMPEADTTPSFPADIYSTGGALVRAQATAEELHSLTPGIYIVRSATGTSKVIIR